MNGLTMAEMRVVDQIAHGCSNDEAALRLHVSINTVKSHLARISRKLDTSSRAGMVGKCYRNGWLPVDTPVEPAARRVGPPAPTESELITKTRAQVNAAGFDTEHSAAQWAGHPYAPLDDVMRVMGGTPMRTIDAERQRMPR